MRPSLPFRLSTRLFLSNLLLVFLPVSGLFYLDLYERELLTQQEKGMVQQGRLLAAALGGRETLTAEDAAALLARLEARTESRLRIYGAGGLPLADSSRTAPSPPTPIADPRYLADPGEEAARASPERRSPIYRLGAALFRFFEPLLAGREESGNVRSGPRKSGLPSALAAALSGRYGGGVERSPGQRSLTLHSAIPVLGTRGSGEVIGAVVVTQSTVRVLRSLYAVRLRIFEILLASIGAAVLLSLLLATTISRPLARLSAQAVDLVDRRGRLRGRFKGLKRRDEIGELARALEALTARLEGHLGFIESFAADVAHEFKNPLAAIRNAIELLDGEGSEQEHRRLSDLALAEISRLERLLGSVGEITAIDARLEAEPTQRVALRDLISRLVAGFKLRHPTLRFELEAPEEKLWTRASPDRLAQLFENLLDNAASFSPPDARIALRLRSTETQVGVEISDQGPGIPPADRERVFERFFSSRSEGRTTSPHAGLGLAIVRAIVEGYGGNVRAASGRLGGATIEVRLPRE
ncbi:MAG TPA: ATP-binding protein [Thermoanaerobaculia bacterium]|jgi:two-component system sensor histidine kinase ChvG|nr:ATP-binding protein [Thermoanaerobaculia bacterium]